MGSIEKVKKVGINKFLREVTWQYQRNIIPVHGGTDVAVIWRLNHQSRLSARTVSSQKLLTEFVTIVAIMQVLRLSSPNNKATKQFS
jgi:hypothetical protein